MKLLKEAEYDIEGTAVIFQVHLQQLQSVSGKKSTAVECEIEVFVLRWRVFRAVRV